MSSAPPTLTEISIDTFSSSKNNRQVIVVENTDPPSDVELGDRVEHFSGIEGEGRFGLFPVS
jgi:hypothetical protein